MQCPDFGTVLLPKNIKQKYAAKILGINTLVFYKSKSSYNFKYNVLFEDMYFLYLCKGELLEFLKTIYLILKTFIILLPQDENSVQLKIKSWNYN